MIDWSPPLLLNGNIIFPQTWVSSSILVNIASPVPPSWRKAGTLTIEISIEDESIIVVRKNIEFGKTLINIPVTNYTLSFVPVPNLLLSHPNTSISLYQLSEQEIINIMPLYTSLAAASAVQPITDSIPTSFNAPVYNFDFPASTYQCLAANPARKSFSVTNIGTADVYLDLDGPSAIQKRSITISAGATYVSDFAYVGAVFIWVPGATLMPCEIRQFV